uniref:RING-type domain-containing protein n=1 Tax=Davidia involucrata TaxID=16924 RepID=A0A5B7A279_DAVIN
MGSSSSRLGSRPSRSPRPNRTRRTLSSLLLCGGSTSHSTFEMDDDPAQLLVNSAERSDPVVDFHSPTKDSALTSGTETGFTSPKAETGASSETSRAASEDSSSEDGLNRVQTSNQGICLSGPPRLLNADYRHSDTASTSYEDWSRSDPVSANGKANMDVVDGVDHMMNEDVSRIHSEVTDPISSSPQEPGDSLSDGVSVENHVTELMANNSDSGAGPFVSDSQVTFHSLRNDTLQEAMPSGLGFLVSDREGGQRSGSVLHVDVVSISSNILSSSTAEISSRETRRNSRRLFWDAFSRRSSRRHSDSRTFLFSTDDTDDLGSHDRWLLDFSGDFFDDGVGGDSGYLGSRTHSMNERRWHSRSEIWERLRGSLNGSDRRTTMCPSGLHPDGTCSCESILMSEESSTRASISRIVMLAEALFEVLDEIHRQPGSLSLSMLSRPAPESVVDSFPVKNHRKPNTTESGDDVAQCYICLAEYEEGDKIRVLPCHHEYHMSCVDKWLKEIHGVCPLCRGDVREGITEPSVSNSEILSL